MICPAMIPPQRGKEQTNHEQITRLFTPAVCFLSGFGGHDLLLAAGT
jgi:hypothetical protein